MWHVGDVLKQPPSSNPKALELLLLGRFLLLVCAVVLLASCGMCRVVSLLYHVCGPLASLEINQQRPCVSRSG